MSHSHGASAMSNPIKIPGIATGKKKAFTERQLRMLRDLLEERENLRDQALLMTWVDTSLRASDIRRLTISHIRTDFGTVRDNIKVRQQKTNRSLTCVLTTETQSTLSRWLEIHIDPTRVGVPLFPSRKKNGAITVVRLRQIVKSWAKLIGLDPTLYGTHSMRRTKPTILYQQTRDILLAQKLLGHNSLVATDCYLDIDDVKITENIRNVNFW